MDVRPARPPLEVEITPEPDPAAAAAIVDAVGRAVEAERGFGAPPGYRSRWREEAAREAVDGWAGTP